MIKTPRLNIRPLSYAQLCKYVAADNSLEKELGLNKSDRLISPELKEAMEETILPNVKKNKEKFEFHTLWTAIDTELNEMIGDICIVGEPNNEGEIEIGYGTYDKHQGKGYMTEMVAGMIDWAKKHDLIHIVLASTEKTNTASFRVLENNNFIKKGESDTLYHWSLTL